jgi:hypothetical protein
MIPGSTVKVLKAEYKVDAKDGQPRLYYYCDVDNSTTASGGTGSDKGWIYAGYVHMDITAPTIPEVTPVPQPTEVNDIIPDGFDFKDKINQPLNQDVPADETITISGINKPSLLNITNGEYSIDGGVWNNVPVDIQNGQKLRIRNKTSQKYNTPTTTTVNIG